MKIAMTSIAPRHAVGHVQSSAVQSWIDNGFKVYSFNCPTEIEQLKEQYPHVTFVPCHGTMRGVFKAPYVPISAFINYAKEHDIEQVLLLNSDIVIKDEQGALNRYLDWASNGLVIANREDHNGDYKTPIRYPHGFDAFIIHKNYYDRIPTSMFCMGQTWWDYWLPYRFLKQNIPVVIAREEIFFHHRHPVQYDGKEWVKMTQHFQWIEAYNDKLKPQQVTGEVYNYIRRHSK